MTMVQEKTIICYSCGKELERIEGRMPCEDLSGWFMVSYLKGKESVDHYSFCSADCLYEWSRGQITSVPDVFLKSFEEDD